MADFYALAVKLEDIPKEYFSLIQSANAEHQREYMAAVKIQSSFRGWVVARRFKDVVKAARYIQRIAKGLVARHRVHMVRLMKIRAENMHFFHHNASIIQKFWRGFWSRRKLIDFYERRRYLDQVVAKGGRTVEFLTRQFKDKLAEVQIEEERATAQAFSDLTSQLHHLVSTRVCAGVFHTQYAPELPSVFHKPLEQHLRDNVRIGPIKSLRHPPLLQVPNSARADFAGSQDTSGTFRPDQMYPTPPSQAPPSQRTPRPPKVMQRGKVLPMKSPRACEPSGNSPSSKVSPKAPAKLPSLPGSPRKMQTAR